MTKQPPQEMPTEKKPHQTIPTKDPNLSPSKTNPINPKSDEPTKNSKK